MYWSFGSADLDKIASETEQTPFLPTCFTNFDNFYEELEEYVANLIRRNVPSRTRHRESLPPWIKPSTSHLLRKLETQRKRFVLRPTSYRKTFVAKLQSLVSELIEQDRKEYQNSLLGSRATGLIFKHLKSLTKDSNFPSEMEYDGRTAYTTQNQASLFNTFFNSVFSAKEPFRIEDIKVENPTLTNFSISKANIESILLKLYITKTRGPHGIPPILYQQTSEQMSSTLHKVFKNIQRLKRLPKKWKVAAVSPIYKKQREIDEKLSRNIPP